MSISSPRRRRAPRGLGVQLHDEILDATTDLLIETGQAKSVSIRAVARRVGVTPPSIYLHFVDKDALLDAVCARYFERLDAVMEKVAAEQPSTVERLWSQGMAYVHFAAENSELYRLATMGEPRPGSDVDVAINSSAFVHLRDTVQALMDEGTYLPGDVTVRALELLTVVHGVSALLVSRPYLPFGDVDAFVDRVLRAACCGHVVLGVIGPDTRPREAVARIQQQWQDEAGRSGQERGEPCQ